MTNQAFASASFFGSVIFYCIVSAAVAANISDRNTYYHGVRSLWSSIISLTCVSITLGTGVSFVLTQAKISNYFAFLTPIGIFCGYWIAGKWTEYLRYEPNTSVPNIHQLLKRNKDAPVASRSNMVAATYALMLILTFVLVISYELWTSSRYIASLMFFEFTPELQVVTSVVIFFIVAGYTTISGLRGAVTTDIMQSIFIVVFIVCLAMLFFDFNKSLVATTHNNDYKNIDLLSILAAILGLITAITTQIYNIVNSTMGGNLSIRDQRRLFNWTGALTGIFYAIIVFIGIRFTFSEDLSQAFNWLLRGESSPVLVVLLMAGMLAILMSTIDSAIVALSQLIYENIFDGNSQLTTAPDEKAVVTKLKIYTFVGSIVVYLITVSMIYLAPNAFYLLLNILFVTTVATPLAMVVMRLHVTGRRSLLDNTGTAATVVAALAAGWGVYVIAGVYAPRIVAVAFHIGFFLACGLFALTDWKLNSNSLK